MVDTDSLEAWLAACRRRVEARPLSTPKLTYSRVFDSVCATDAGVSITGAYAAIAVPSLTFVRNPVVSIVGRPTRRLSRAALRRDAHCYRNIGEPHAEGAPTSGSWPVDLLLMSAIHADTKSSGGLLVDSRKVRWLSVTIALIVACGTK